MTRLTDTRTQVALVLTGGGTRIIGQCFARPGASACWIEAVVPYSRAALAAYLERYLESTEMVSKSPPEVSRGNRRDSSGESFPRRAVCAETARLMASTAHARCVALSDVGDARHSLGVAVTCRLPTWNRNDRHEPPPAEVWLAASDGSETVCENHQRSFATDTTENLGRLREQAESWVETAFWTFLSAVLR